MLQVYIWLFPVIPRALAFLLGKTDYLGPPAKLRLKVLTRNSDGASIMSQKSVNKNQSLPPSYKLVTGSYGGPQDGAGQCLYWVVG